MEEAYRSHAGYLKEKYGAAAYRVAVDAGFGCPNRERGGTGCRFCGETGSRAPYTEASEKGGPADLRRQVERAIGFLRRRYGAEVFLLYFQAFSGTYAPVERLRSTFDAGLSCAPFRQLIVSTRPDCVDAEKAALLASYVTAERDVWVELGLQSAQDRTLSRIGRGHSVGDFDRAYRLLKARGVKVGIHLIFGLPGETSVDMEASMRFVASLRPDGVKIHNLHVVRDAALFLELQKGEVCAPGPEAHMEYLIRALELLPPETVILRLVCDTAADRLAAPRNFPPKAEFRRRLLLAMKRRGARQGRLFSSPPPEEGTACGALTAEG